MSAPVAVIEGIAADAIPYADLLEKQQPAILRGVVRDWPLVRAGLESAEAAIAYLRRFESERPVTVYAGAPEIGGRFFYNDDVRGMNYAAGREPLGTFLDRLAASDEAGPSFYMGSTDLDLFLPGLRGENDLALDDPMFAANPPIVSIWIGNRTIASAHYDMSHNMACCVAGQRRFTLFPPDQVANLYPGPLEPTPGGQ
ncbi:MAG: cupin-like domain-containing protein, partial [Sphingomonadales bacterium]